MNMEYDLSYTTHSVLHFFAVPTESIDVSNFPFSTASVNVANDVIHGVLLPCFSVSFMIL